MQAPKQPYALLDETECVCQVALEIGGQGQVVEGKANRPLHTEFAEDQQALLAVRPHLRDIALIPRDIAQRQLRLSDTLAVAKRTMELHALFEQRRGAGELALLTQQQPQPVECQPQTASAQAATITPGAVLCDCLFQQ